MILTLISILTLTIYTGKGKCAIDAVLLAPYGTARASPMDVSNAAYALIERCTPRTGGRAVDIGSSDLPPGSP